jgi:3-hydroxyacyl-[acyl-carrier-protein] dehydratase
LSVLKLNKDEIIQILNIKPPFLFVDKIDVFSLSKSALGQKKLTSVEWFFNCHLPAEHVMPGTLLTEAMLQTLVAIIYSIEGHVGKIAFVTEMNTKLLSKASPGDDLLIEAKLTSFERGISKGEATVSKNKQKKVCFGEFTFVSPHALPKPRLQ